MGISSNKTKLGLNIKELRVKQGLTLDSLSKLTAISRATLSRIENGDVSPTAEVLGSLSTALKKSISQILAPLEKKFIPLVPRDSQTIWNDPENVFQRRNISPPSAQLSIELIKISLGPQQRIKYPSAPVSGIEHHIYLISGELTVTVDDIEHHLTAGDCLRYKLYGETIFRTLDSEVQYLLALA